MSDDAAPAVQAAAHTPVRPRRRRWPRIVGLIVVIPIAWATLMIAGPAPFVLLLMAVMIVDLFLDRHRSAERRADLRWRRQRGLERALEDGGPSDKPTARHKSPDPGQAERTLYGNRQTGHIRGAFPRGRI